MRAFSQRSRGRKGPGSVGVHSRSADLCAIVIDGDERAWLACSPQRRRRIVGDAAVRDRSDHRRDIIGSASNAWRGRSDRVDHEDELRRCRARIVELVGRRGRQPVNAVGKGRLRCEGPTSVGTCRCRADQLAVVIDGDGASGLRRAGERRRRVIRLRASRDRSDNWRLVVCCRKGRNRGCGRVSGLIIIASTANHGSDPTGRRRRAQDSKQCGGRVAVGDLFIGHERVDDSVPVSERLAEIRQPPSVVMNEDQVVVVHAVGEEPLNAH